MDTINAARIITALANGVNPYTREILEANGPFQNPDTVRALFLAIKGLEILSVREKRSSRLPSNAGKPWSESEDNNLIKEFDEGILLKELSSMHGRTAGAIKSRLLMLGKSDSEVIGSRIRSIGNENLGNLKKMII